MTGDDGVRRAFGRWSGDVDIAVVEAMGALYDGEDGTENGSAAAVAKLLGLREFDPDVRIAGCVLNRVGSTAHAEMISAALNEEQRELVVGTIQREDALDIPERHLGLLTATENQRDAKAREQAQLRAGAGLDLERIAAIAGTSMPQDRPPVAVSDTPACPRPRARLALARDGAPSASTTRKTCARSQRPALSWCLLVPPRIRRCPMNVDAVYIGGGYPESFAAELSANTLLAADLRQKATQGVPIYAECGGLLYLGRSLTGFDGARHAMSGLLLSKRAWTRRTWRSPTSRRGRDWIPRSAQRESWRAVRSSISPELSVAS
jgi:cobyrinic acid a,c-diamide synthase